MKIYSCNKVRFATSKDADISAARARIYSKKEKIPVRSYFCNICNFYHLTSSKTVLQDNNDYLAEKYNKIKSDYEILLSSYNLLSKNTKEELFLIKTNERVEVLSKNIEQLNKTIKRIRRDNMDLIVKNIQLQNRIDELLN